MYKRLMSTLLIVQMLLSSGLSAGAISDLPPLEDSPDPTNIIGTIDSGDPADPVDPSDTADATQLFSSVNIDNQDVPEVSSETTFVEGELISVEEDNEIDNDTLYQAYILQQMGLNEKPQTLADYYEKALNDTEKEIYIALKEQIEKVAAGTITHTNALLTIDTSTLPGQWEWSSTDNTPLATGAEAIKSFRDQKYAEAFERANIDRRKIIDCLQVDCPYELYWFDKTEGWSCSYSYSSSYFDGAKTQLSNLHFTQLSFSFLVSENYAGSVTTAQDKAGYITDEKKTKAAAAVMTNVQTILDKYANETDYNKLVKYKEEICALVTYNDDAANDKNNTPYGDPWQLIYVFDGDLNTNVVCEGYSKAFQYLCDHTTFQDNTIVCYTVDGDMVGGTGSGGHMWNIVTIGENNYLADVTNSDEESIGYQGGLFLAGSTNEQEYEDLTFGYTMDIPGQESIAYKYNKDTLALYGEKILKLAATNYQPFVAVTPVYEELPTASATYGATLQETTLTGGRVVDPDDGEITVEGKWAWKDPTESVGNVTEEGKERSFKAVFTPTDTNKYKPLELDVKVTVKQRPINDSHIEFAPIDPQTYTGSAIQPADITATFQDKKLVKDQDYTLSYGGNINAGKGAGTVIVTGVGNFCEETTLSFDITQGTPIVDPTQLTIDKPTAIYGDTLTVTVPAIQAAQTRNVAANQVGLYCGKTELAIATVTDGQATILTYDTTKKLLPISENQTLTVQYGGSGNLTASDNLGKVTVTLNKKPLTATTTDPVTKPYDGNTTFSDIALTLDGVANGDTVTATIPTATVKSANAGDYTAFQAADVTLAGKDAGWYVAPETVALKDGGTIHITKLEPVFTVNPTSQIVGAESVIFTIQMTNEQGGFPTSNQIVIKLDASVTGVTQQGTVSGGNGTYTATFKLPKDLTVGTEIPFTVNVAAEAQNYSPLSDGHPFKLAITNKFGTNTALTVDKKTVVYGDSVQLTATVTKANAANPGELSGTVIFKDGDTPIGDPVAVQDGKATIAAFIPKTVGEHTFTAAFTSGNPSFNDSSTTAKVQVDPKELTLTLAIPSYEYNGDTKVDLSKATTTLTGKIGEDEVSVVLPTEGGSVDTATVGENKLVTLANTPTLTGAAETNYMLAETVAGLTVTITPKPLTVDHATIEPKVFDNTTKAVVTEVTFAGLVSGETLTLDADKDFTATGTFDSAAVGTGRTVKITLAPVASSAVVQNYTLPESFTLENQTIEKGTAPAAGWSTNATLTKNQPSATTTVDLLAIPGTFLTATDQFAVPEPAEPYQGLTSATISGTTLTLVANNATAATDTVVVTVQGMANYKDTATITITVTYTNKKQVKVTGITVAGKTYDGTAIQPNTTGIQFAGAAEGTLVTANDVDLTYAEKLPDGTLKACESAPVNAGNYQLVASVKANHPTYTGSSDPIPFTIDKAKVTIQVKENKRINPGEEAPTLSADDYTVTGLVGSDKLTTLPTIQYNPVSPDTGKPDTAKPGTVAIEVSGAEASSNYTITYVNGTLTIGTPPTGSLSFGGQKWTANADSTTWYYNGDPSRMRVSIALATAEGDKDKAKVTYTTSATAIADLTTVPVADWAVYTAPFALPANASYVYAKLTDSYDSTTYLGSAKLVFDQTPPVIAGVENNATYHKAPTITVTDANLKEVTINGTPVTLDDKGSYSMVGNTTGEKQTIIATDHAGNTTTVTVIAYNGHQFKTETKPSECAGADGSITIRTCTLCGYKETTSTGSVEHQWETEPTIDKPATCTTEGSQSIHCSKCDAIQEVKAIPATGHDITAHKWASNLTTHWNICANDCGIKVGEEPHTGSGWKDIEKDGEQTGMQYTECTVCGLRLAERFVTPDGTGLIKQTDVADNAPETTFAVDVDQIDTIIDTTVDHVTKDDTVDVKVTLKVAPLENPTTDDSATALEEEAKKPDNALTIGRHLDIKLEKTPIVNGTPRETVPAIVNPGHAVTITIVIPEDLRKPDEGKKRTFRMMHAYKKADSSYATEILTPTATTDTTLTFKANQFSTYAIAYKDETVANPTPSPSPSYPSSSGGSSGGGGGGGPITYRVTASNPLPHGSVSVTPSQTRKDKKVTITLNPDAGYEVDTLTVLQRNGKTVACEKIDDTHYTFIMPSANVSVKVTFKEAIGSTVPPTPSTPSSFNDVPSNSWYAGAVQYIVDQGMMNGTGNNQFSPNASTTRGMIVTILHRREQTPTAEAAPFTDVADNLWYTDAVAWAAANEIVNGYGNNTFRPNVSISREQMAAILWRYAKYKQYDVSVGEDTNILSFNDSSSISEYAIPALQWACGAGIITGKDGNILDPKGNTTRAQVATMLQRFMTKVVPAEEETKSDTADNSDAKSDTSSDTQTDTSLDSKADDKTDAKSDDNADVKTDSQTGSETK